MEKENIQNKEDQIDLRSEPVQELLGEVPSWILRWGITLFGAIILLIIIASCLIKYPDTITAKITVTTTHPPAAIYSKTTGRIKKLYVGDKQQVAKGEYMAVIENNTRLEDLFTLKRILQQIGNDSLGWVNWSTSLQLGEMQSDYVAFSNAAHRYIDFSDLKYYDRKSNTNKKSFGTTNKS